MILVSRRRVGLATLAVRRDRTAGRSGLGQSRRVGRFSLVREGRSNRGRLGRFSPVRAVVRCRRVGSGCRSRPVLVGSFPRRSSRWGRFRWVVGVRRFPVRRVVDPAGCQGPVCCQWVVAWGIRSV